MTRAFAVIWRGRNATAFYTGNPSEPWSFDPALAKVYSTHKVAWARALLQPGATPAECWE